MAKILGNNEQKLVLVTSRLYRISILSLSCLSADWEWFVATFGIFLIGDDSPSLTSPHTLANSLLSPSLTLPRSPRLTYLSLSLPLLPDTSLVSLIPWPREVQNMSDDMSGTCSRHECKQATNMPSI